MNEGSANAQRVQVTEAAVGSRPMGHSKRSGRACKGQGRGCFASVILLINQMRIRPAIKRRSGQLLGRSVLHHCSAAGVRPH